MRRYLTVILSLFLCLYVHAQTHDTDVWTVFGDVEVVNGSKAWDVTVEANNMTLKGGIWTLTVKNVKLYQTTTGSCHPDPYHFAFSLNHSKTNTLPEYLYDTDEQDFYVWSTLSIYVSKPGYYDITYTFNGLEVWYSNRYSLEYIKPLEPEYTVTVSSSDPSKGTATGGGSFVCGETTTIKATSLPGNRFTGWSDGNTATTRTLTVKKDASYVAYFEEGGYVVIGDGELLNSTSDWQIEAQNTMQLQEDGSYSFTVRTTLEKIGTYCHPVYRCAVALSSDGKVVFPTAVYANGEYLRSKGVAVSITQSGVYDVLFTFKEGGTKPTVKPTLVESLPDPTYTVTVQPNIAEGGTVTGDGVYECGASYTITATAFPGFCFSKWSDGKTAPSRTITAAADADYIAEFKTCGFSVSGEGGGDMVSLGGGLWQYIVHGVLLSPTCGTALKYSVIDDDNGTTKNITISKSSVPEAGLYDITISFTEGSSKPTYTLTLIEAIPDVKYTVTAVPDDPERGTVSGGGEYACGQSVTVKATANPGWKFSKWDNGKTASSQTFSVKEDTTLVAIFVPIIYTVVGDVDVVNGEKAFDKENEENDMEVNASRIWTLTVHNKLLYRTGTYCHTPYKYAVVLDHKGSYKPSTTPQQISITKTGYYDLTYTWNQTNSTLTCKTSLIEEVENNFVIEALSDNPAQGVTTQLTRRYECGEEVKIKATPLPGNRFVKWSNGITTATQTIIVTKDSTVTAYFEPVSWTLIGDADVVNGEKWDATNTANDMHLTEGVWTITIADKQLEKTGTGCHDTYRFGVANNHSLDVTSPTGIQNGTSYKRTSGVALNVGHSGRYNIIYTYTDGETKPKFRLDTIQLLPNPTYTVTVQSANESMGSVTGSGDYECGSTVTIRAETKSNSTFLRWSDNNTSQERTIGPLKSNVTLTAYFEDDVYTVVGDHAILNGETDWDLYEPANTMERVYDALEGEWLYVLRVKRCYLSTCYNGGVYEYRVVHNHAYVDENGYSSAFPETSTATLKITKNGLYDIVFKFDASWYGYGGEMPERKDPRPERSPQRPRRYLSNGIEAQEFIIEEYGTPFTIDVASANSIFGYVTGGGQYNCGETVTISAIANEGYIFKRWSDDSTDATRTFTAEGDMQLVAFFDCTGGCDEIEELYLGHEATSLTVEEQLLEPTFLAYPDAVETLLPTMVCADGESYEENYIQGALVGLFSVAKGKQVRFSQGNLQYLATSDTYRFAPEQYQVFPPLCEEYFDYLYCEINLKTPPQIDIFPYVTDKFWAANIPDFWRILSGDEWNYLLNKRTNYNKLRTKVAVNDIPGLIILPDNYTHTLPFALKLNSSSYATNKLTDSQFELLERAGAVFLPAAGYAISPSYYEAPRRRLPQKIAPEYENSYYFYGFYEYGYYWTTTVSDFSNEYFKVFYFTSSGNATLGTEHRSSLFPIRLVTDNK